MVAAETYRAVAAATGNNVTLRINVNRRLVSRRLVPNWVSSAETKTMTVAAAHCHVAPVHRGRLVAQRTPVFVNRRPVRWRVRRAALSTMVAETRLTAVVVRRVKLVVLINVLVRQAPVKPWALSAVL